MRCACRTGWLRKASLRSASKFGKHCFAPAEPGRCAKRPVGVAGGEAGVSQRMRCACRTGWLYKASLRFITGFAAHALRLPNRLAVQSQPPFHHGFRSACAAPAEQAGCAKPASAQQANSASAASRLRNRRAIPSQPWRRITRPFAAFTASRRPASPPRPGPSRPARKKNGHLKRRPNRDHRKNSSGSVDPGPARPARSLWPRAGGQALLLRTGNRHRRRPGWGRCPAWLPWHRSP